ncbi:MAG TPA: NAD(P)/FAD-dependent oxidoreductase [Acidimicrobiales bacterium]|nr:NAD(P)/FAD-dependent oxidoreductase [Acidimicrobiales bacterium]
MLDAVVVGSGPNGLTAAVTLAQAGLQVRVFEAADKAGGGTRTEELTLPGFRHDVCSAVHPFGVGSPALAALPLADHGLEWIHPQLALAHPLLDGSAAVLARSVDETVASLGRDDRTWRRLVGPFLGRWRELAGDVLGPIGMRLPRHPVLLARFGARAVWPVQLAARVFREDRTRMLLAGIAGHAIVPSSSPLTTSVGLMLALAAHEVGWPVARGGSQAIADSLISYLESLGGGVETGALVTALDQLPLARAYLFDVMPRDLAAIAGNRLPDRYRAQLGRYRHGPAVFKVDYALADAVPWKAEECRRAATVHLGASLDEIGGALAAVASGRPPDPPFLIVAQPTIVDASRAPAGRHVLWAYGHVPRGWRGDLTAAIEDQIERFAPGFRDLVLARSAWGPPKLEAHNRSMVDGDIAGGVFQGLQVLFRPVIARVPYATPDPAIFLCSAATPPGPGVHGMGGHLAATVALRRVFGVTV